MNFATLVDAATLRAHLGNPLWRLIDVRHQLAEVQFGRRVYSEGHVPGAVFLHCDEDLSGRKTGRNGRHPLPEPEDFAETLRRSGVSDQNQIVVYDDAQGMIASRLWWMCRWIGHERVAVLDGGLQEWLAAGGHLTSESVRSASGNLTARPSTATVDADKLLRNLREGHLLLVDARSPDRFRGENETLDPVGGHIPGAVNRFFRDNYGSNGCFKSSAELHREWSAILAGKSPETVVHQCGSGVSACVNLLAMEHAGLHGSSLYPGSWSEWCSDPVRPISV